jgi:polygalacturonase
MSLVPFRFPAALAVAALAWAVCPWAVAADADAATIGPNTADAKLVEEVVSGKRAEANAAWWGFDPDDATETLQKAIDSGAKKLVVPNLGKPWILSKTLRLTSNQEIVFEPGVTLLAMKGEFLGPGDALASAADRENVKLIGPGATFRMNKADYHKPPYEKAEWRHALSICGCSNVTVIGLSLCESGGDGIYLGATGKNRYNKDIVIKGVACDGNNRQGISVISAENLLIEDCRLDNTRGTPPAAGIDFEPNSDNERLVNCVVRNCTVKGNHGPGLDVYLRPLSDKSPDVSIRFENCRVENDDADGLCVAGVRDGGPGGVIEFKNVTVDGTTTSGLRIEDKAAGRALVRLVGCTFKNTARQGGHPLYLAHRGVKTTRKNGGVEFVDCTVEDDRDRPFLVADEPAGQSVRGIHGNVTVKNHHGAKMSLGAKPVDVDLKVEH